MKEYGTQNLILRYPMLSDSKELFEVLSNPNVTRFMSMDPFDSLEMVEKSIESWSNKYGTEGFYVFSIVEKATGKVIGLINTCGLHHGNPVVGYCLNEKYWGKSYMTQCLNKFCELLFDDGYTAIVIEAAKDNIASNEVIRKNGFGYVGSYEEALTKKKPEKIVINGYRKYKENHLTKRAEEIEDKLNSVFCKEIKLSRNLIRLIDEELKSMYDLNFFSFVREYKEEDVKLALDFQKKRGEDFLKFLAKEPFSTKVIKEKKFEESCILTMGLQKTDMSLWSKNVNIKVRSLKEENYLEEDFAALEIDNFKDIYGKVFCEEKTRHWLSKVKEDTGLNFYGAYLDDKLVGSLYTFNYEGDIIIDGLFVLEGYRNQYIATSLLYEAIKAEKANNVFLHADADDTPKEMYIKLGFNCIDYHYEYFKKI